MNEKTYNTPTGGPNSTYVPLVATMTQVDLLSRMAGQKSVEHQTLECLQRIECLLKALVDRAGGQDGSVGNGGDVTDVIKVITPTETPFNKRIDPRAREKRK